MSQLGKSKSITLSHHLNRIKIKIGIFELKTKKVTGIMSLRIEQVRTIRIFKGLRKVYLLIRGLVGVSPKRMFIFMKATEYKEIECHNSEIKMKDNTDLHNKGKNYPGNKCSNS